MSKRDYIVSSAHLADPGTEELSEFEYGLILAHNAFERWLVRCMAAAGYPDLSKVDIQVLHSVPSSRPAEAAGRPVLRPQYRG